MQQHRHTAEAADNDHTEGARPHQPMGPIVPRRMVCVPCDGYGKRGTTFIERIAIGDVFETTCHNCNGTGFLSQ